MLVWRAIGGRLRLFSRGKGRGVDSSDSSNLDARSPTDHAAETRPPTSVLALSAVPNQPSDAVLERIEPQELQGRLDLFLDVCSPTERTAETRPQTPVLAPSAEPIQPGDAALERIEPHELRSSLDLFAGLQRAFTLDEFQEWLGPGVDSETLTSILVADPRIVALGTQDASTGYFVSIDALFRWYVFTTLRLAQAGQTRLKALQVAYSMTSLRLDDQWTAPPPTAIAFGQNYGFIAPAIIAGEYVFPIAQVLARLPYHSVSVAKSVLQAMTYPLTRDPAFGRPLDSWVEEGLANFDGRVVEVVQSREGFNGGEPQTLAEIGVRLGVTRERVRQLEATFWERLSPDPVKVANPRLESRFRPNLLRPFVVGLVTEIMRRRGSLVLDSQSPQDGLITFVARCVGLSPIEIPSTNLAILGTTNTDNLAINQNAPSLDLAEIAKWVDGYTNLSKEDVSVIACHAAEHRLQKSNKAQGVYLALKHIGKPAHFSEIADVYNTLFPDDPSTEHNVHAVLTREQQQQGIVWIGIKGTYALKEWGYERPSIGLYDAVADIVQRIHERGGNPVSGDVIRAEIGKYRRVLNPDSIQMAIDLNPRIRKVSAGGFVPKDPNETDESELSAAELDRILREFEKTTAERIPDQENT